MRPHNRRRGELGSAPGQRQEMQRFTGPLFPSRLKRLTLDTKVLYYRRF